MNTPEKLLDRLNKIGEVLSTRSDTRALIGLGSVGTELKRLDVYSDLDFFVIVEAASKQRYIDKLDWLAEAADIVYAFRNTTDGYKLLYDDGIFCEMAVFAPEELDDIPFAEGRIVWKATGVDGAIHLPKTDKDRLSAPAETEWLVGEAITNLYVGLCRFHRGEKLSAARFVQGYAVDRILELSYQLEAVVRTPTQGIGC